MSGGGGYNNTHDYIYLPKDENAVVRSASRHLYLRDGSLYVVEVGGPRKPEVEADNEFIRIGCTSISYEAFRKLADWWEQTRKSNVRRMQ